MSTKKHGGSFIFLPRFERLRRSFAGIESEETGDFIVTDAQNVVEFKLNSVDPLDISDATILFTTGATGFGSRFCTYMLNGYKAFGSTSGVKLRVLDDTNTQIQEFDATVNGITNASYNELGQVTVLDTTNRFSHYNADASLNNSASISSSRLYGGVQSIFDGKFYYMNNHILRRRDTLDLDAGFEDMQTLRAAGGTVRGSFSANKFGWMCIFTPNNSNATVNTLALVGPPPHCVRKWKFEEITTNTKAVVITDENRIFVTRTETGPLHYLDERSFDTGEVLHTYDITTQIGASTVIVPIGGMRYFDKFQVLVIAGKIINANTGALIHDTGYGSNGRCDIFPTDNTIRAEFIAEAQTFSTDFSELDDGVIWYQDTWLWGWIQHAPSTRYSVVSDAGYTGGKYLSLLLNATNFGMLSWDKVGGSSNDFSIETTGIFQIPVYRAGRAAGFALHAIGEGFNEPPGGWNKRGIVVQYLHGTGLRVTINKTTFSTFTILATDATMLSNITGRFHIKVALSRTNIKVRFWLFGDAEPVTWNIDSDQDFSDVRMGAHGVYFAGNSTPDSETRVDQVEFKINQ